MGDGPFTTFLEATEAGHRALRESRFSDAERAFESAISLAPDGEDCADALHFSAYALMNMSRGEEARERLQKVLASSEARPDQRGSAMHLTAHSHINEGRGHLADEWWDRIVALEGAAPIVLCEARLARGYTLRAQKKHSEALAEFAACLEVSGGLAMHHGSARFHTALTYLELNDRESAEKELRQFLLMGGTYPEERTKGEKLMTQLKKTE